MEIREMISIVENANETGKKPAWTVFMVYGSFDEPTTNKNFIIVRMPKGRVPWTRKIIPAIDKLVRQWFSPEQRERDKYAKQRGRERECFWQVEGELTEKPEESYWLLKMPVARYEWNGEALVKAPIDVHLHD